ncbi:hypothetical protein Baya_11492 [Bagarius yarrelli]|uniref:G-protein coupled receptors family 1 profile domain-containing protein n=1 Tax=Bagarius yarrelli TaxID=175774 RepID=A0A556UZF7_BAGYA|nr:hypothetical protein Baya_11492 [Bagarius yarrelli]
MDNQILNHWRNLSLSSCSEPYTTVYFWLNNMLLFLTFPTSAIVIVTLLIRIYGTSCFTPAEVFLLQINFTNISVCISYLLLVLDDINACQFSMTVFLIFFSPSLTARPLFMFANCMIFYVAIVHPVTYRTAKTLRHWEWLVSALTWCFALIINLAIIIYKIDIFQLGFIMTFYSTILPSMILYVIILRTLASVGPGNGGQTLNPAKRKAFQIILSILVITLLYYIPRVLFLVYPYVAPMDWQRFLCAEGQVIILLPKVSEIVLPIIILCCLYKVDI